MSLTTNPYDPYETIEVSNVGWWHRLVRPENRWKHIRFKSCFPFNCLEASIFKETTKTTKTPTKLPIRSPWNLGRSYWRSCFTVLRTCSMWCFQPSDINITIFTQLGTFPPPPPQKKSCNNRKKPTDIPKYQKLLAFILHDYINYSTNFFHGVTFFEGNPPHHPTSMVTKTPRSIHPRIPAETQPSYCGVRNGTSMCRWNTSRDPPFSRVAITRPGSNHKQCQVRWASGVCHHRNETKGI